MPNLRPRGLPWLLLAFVGGIGSGKTTTGAEKFVEACRRNRGLPHGVYGPTYPMLRDATKPAFLEALQRKGVPYRNVPSENMVELWGDTPVLFRSMDDPDRLRGPNLAAGWVDEPFQMTSRATFDVIIGRIRHPDAKEQYLQLTGSPAGLTWAYDVLVVDADKNHARVY